MTKPNHQRITVTAALPYTNGPVHIGQLAGAYVPADVYARYMRLKMGDDKVAFICGSDEHGVAITLRARKEGKTPQEVVDHYHQVIKQSFEELGVSFNIYHRTSSELHKETAQAFFLKLYEKGLFVEKETEQYYDAEYHQFLADRYISGTCPNCGHDKAYGDQCENCGKSLSPSDLINPVSTLSGEKPIKKKTTHWFLPLDKIQEEWLDKWVREDSQKVEAWKRNVYGQCLSWLDQGLQPRAMTRDLDWGVPVPIEGAEGKVMYVWFDAPIGYISATRAWAEQQGSDWKPWWQSKDTKLVHFLGKDNIVFHTIIFPALLGEHGDFILPTNVPANEFMNLEGSKMSTSRNWTVWLHEYLEEIPGKQDELRYVLITNLPENKDSEFTWEDYQSKVNNELVATLGNFVNRVLVLTNKYFEGLCKPGSEFDLQGHPLMKAVAKCYKEVDERLEAYQVRSAMEAVMALARDCNKYLTEEEPWKRIKEDEEATRDILWVSIQAIAHLSNLLYPFLPHKAALLKGFLKLEDDYALNDQTALVPAGHRIEAKPGLLFEKIPDELVEAQIEKLNKTREANLAEQGSHAPLRATIEYNDFMGMDLRVASILAAEPVPKTDKLMKISLDLGFEKRTVVSGIAEYFKAEDLPGRKVVLLANLAPRKLRGVESQGMILMAENADGSLNFVSPDPNAENGSTIA
jgi:methionyl-tRNA synthetase